MIVFSEEIRQQISVELKPSLEEFEQILEKVEILCDRTFTVGAPDDSHGRLQYFLDLLRVLHLNKLQQLGHTLITIINTQHYLIYGTVARSIIEFTAVLRYYVHTKIQPLVNQSSVQDSLDLETLSEITLLLEKQVKGTRYNWQNFFDKYVEETRVLRQAELYSQVSVITCLEKWIKDNPEIRHQYELFCDLVHPNLGSSLMLATVEGYSINIGTGKGKPLGLRVFEYTFPNLLEVIKESLNQLDHLEALRKKVKDK